MVDATGVGKPVVDLLRAAGLEPVPMSITSGRSIKFDSDGWRVPKPALVRALVVAVENGKFKIARGLQYARALKRELAAFERKIGAQGHIAFAGAGQHDDLVIATAPVC